MLVLDAIIELPYNNGQDTMAKHRPEQCYRITDDTYVVTHDYNDAIMGADGKYHAQGSHDTHPRKFPQLDKRRWHEIQRMRRHQYYMQSQRSIYDNDTVFLLYAKIKRHLYAVNALCDRYTLKIIKCDGYTHHKIKSNPSDIRHMEHVNKTRKQSILGPYNH